MLIQIQTRELKTASGNVNVMPLQQHVCNGLTRPATPTQQMSPCWLA